MSKIPFTMTNDSITIISDGMSYVIQRGAPNFKAVRDAIINEDWGAVRENLTVPESIKKWAKGKFTISDNNEVSYEGSPLPPEISERIISMAASGDDPTCLFNFWERLQKNPSYRSVTQLWGFLTHTGIPITPDGCFLTYKSVARNYKDHHSGQFDNSPGTTHEMPRNKISDDPKVACHYGFHVGAYAYASTFGSHDRRIVICKVDPEHVVCVPYDSSQQKMRVCKYEVVGNYGDNLPSTTFDYKEERLEDKDQYYDDDDFDDDLDEEDEEIEDEETEEVLEDEETGEIKVEFEEEVTKEDAAKAPKKKKLKASEFRRKFSKMTMEKLLDQSIGALRKYAARDLSIVGASKMSGGKIALVMKIIEVRDGMEDEE
jgi:hypothetical protein